MTHSDPSNARSKLIREQVFCEDARFEASLDKLSLDELRRAFAPLFDRAAHAVEAAGYSQDDSVIIRLVRCRHSSGVEWLTDAESLSDMERLKDCITKAANAVKLNFADILEVELVGLSIQAIIERWEN